MLVHKLHTTPKEWDKNKNCKIHRTLSHIAPQDIECEISLYTGQNSSIHQFPAGE